MPRKIAHTSRYKGQQYAYGSRKGYDGKELCRVGISNTGVCANIQNFKYEFGILFSPYFLYQNSIEFFLNIRF